MTERPKLLFVNDQPQKFHDSWYGFELLKQMDLELFMALPADAVDSSIVDPEHTIPTNPFNTDRLVQDVVIFQAKRGIRFDGCGTVIEELVPPVADLASALGLPGLDPGAARRTSVDKLLMRQTVADAGIDQPRFQVIEQLTEDALRGAAERVGTPCVVKPLGGFLSFGVLKLDRLEDVPAVVAEVTRSWTADVNPDLENTSGAWMLEEYVSGQMLSCEGLVQDGEVHWAPGIVEQHLGEEPHFVEEGFTIPARFNAEETAEIRKRAGAIVAALGLDNCAFHCEMRYTDRGPLLVEIAGREPGTAVAFLGAFGVSFVDAQVALWLGRPATLTKNQDRAIAARLFYPDRSGTLTRFDGIEDARAVEGIWGLIQVTQVGEQALTYPDPPSPIAYFAAVADTREEADRILAEAETKLVVEIDTAGAPAA